MLMTIQKGDTLYVKLRNHGMVWNFVTIQLKLYGAYWYLTLVHIDVPYCEWLLETDVMKC